jgi:hypothetical protein
VRVSVVRGGGIAGISTRTTLVGDDLPADEVDALSRLVQRAGLRRAAPAGSAGGGADQQLYEVEVVDDDGRVSASARSTCPTRCGSSLRGSTPALSEVVSC